VVATIQCKGLSMVVVVEVIAVPPSATSSSHATAQRHGAITRRLPTCLVARGAEAASMVENSTRYRRVS
jgi:hypothetical protein